MYPEFQTRKEIKKTRKLHYCEHCGLEIPIGSKCETESGKFDGLFYSFYTHEECMQEYCDLNKYNEDEDGCAIPLSKRKEYYPHESFDNWQNSIREIYKLGDE